MLQDAETRKLEDVLRAIATAARSLRLYPPASPIPRQSVETVVSALEVYFADGAPVLSLALAREGFSIDGTPVGTQIPGARELSDELRTHGAAEIDLMPETTVDELLAFLSIMARPADEVRAEGGLSALAAAAGVENVRVADVQLTVVDQSASASGADVEEFLRDLSADADKLGAWYSSAATGDPAAFQEGLLELMRVAGPEGRTQLLASLAETFRQQDSDGKDALLALAMDPGGVRELAGQMFTHLESGEIAGSVLEGVFGKNMLSLSNALTKLPLESVTAQVRAEVQSMLPDTGHTAKEADFLDHMLEVRSLATPEPSLVDADRTYRAVVQAATIRDEDVARARGAVAASAGSLNSGSVRTMLSLLDQQQDFELYCASADNLASMVPRLIEQGDLVLASRVITELSNRQAAATGPWPELSARLESALQTAAGPRSMAALVSAVMLNPQHVPAAQEIVRYAGDTGGPALMAEAIAQKDAGLVVAEQLLGRRVIDLLNAAAHSAQWFQLGPVVTRLAADGGPHSVATIEALMRRPDEQSRREVATALAAAGGPIATKLLPAALRDSSPEVAIVAARAIARSGAPGSAALLASRIAEIDIDNADYLLGKELIGALARTPDPAADEALAKLASRRAIIKRGHFADVQTLVAQAQQLRAQGGAGR